MRRIRHGRPDDDLFLVEMARLACTLEDRPLPASDAPDVLACLPVTSDAAVIATDAHDRRLGAAWWHLHEPPLIRTTGGSPLPEMTMAVIEEARDHGIGSALIEALADTLTTHVDAIALNVHLRNPAARLYTRTGFRVAGKGRGWYGVAMTRELLDRPPFRDPASHR